MKAGKTKKRDGGKKRGGQEGWGRKRRKERHIGAIGGWCKGKRKRRDNDKRRKRG